MARSEHRELFALAAWIQTFPEFDAQIYNGGEELADAERLMAALDTSEATRYVSFGAPSAVCVMGWFDWSHLFLLTLFSSLHLIRM